MIDKYLYAFLSSNTAITDLCPRIYGIDAPSDVQMPIIVYSESSNVLQKTWDGTNGLTQSFSIVQAWGSSKAEAEAIGDVIFGEMADYSGAMGDASAEQVFCESSVLGFDDDVKLWGAVLQFEIWYSVN